MADSDRPGGLLEIPASLGRDIDNGKSPPIEAFMSDDALQSAADASTASPVHAEDLRPISASEAAVNRTFSGESLPNFPQTRRVIPPPFHRPSVTGGSHGKAWQPARADQIVKGDIITGLGLVASAEDRLEHETVEGVRAATGYAIVVTGAGGNIAAYRPDEQVRVFRGPEAATA